MGEYEDDFIRTIEDEDDEEVVNDDDRIIIDKGFSFEGDEDPIQNAWDFESARKHAIDKTTVI